MQTSERQAILDLYRGLRVTDVSDGMDVAGRGDLGLMDPGIRPLYRDTEDLTHCFVGFAHTVRFVPTNHPVTARTPEEMKAFISAWYRELARGPAETIHPADVIVIDGCGTRVGFVGSNNGYQWILAGAVGIVTNGGARDTDELIRQRCPVYCARIEKTIRPARLELESEQSPVTCGGVLVRPDDVVVADGDGVVVVPSEVAAEVGRFAREVADTDRAKRRELYQRAGRELDRTVEALPQMA